MDILFYQIAKILSIRLDKSLAFLYIIFTLASYPSGKEAVCKTVMQQFDSARRLANDESHLRLIFLPNEPFKQRWGSIYIFGGFFPLFCILIFTKKSPR